MSEEEMFIEKKPRCTKCRMRNTEPVEVDKILFIKCKECGHELKAERMVRE